MARPAISKRRSSSRAITNSSSSRSSSSNSSSTAGPLPTIPSAISKYIGNVTALTGHDNQHQALELLHRVISASISCMATRAWRVGKVSEMYPSDARLLGLNINHGQEIKIRLRSAKNATRFLTFESLVGTFLHELVHIVRAPHDKVFFQMLDVLTEETEQYIMSGKMQHQDLLMGSNGRVLGSGRRVESNGYHSLSNARGRTSNIGNIRHTKPFNADNTEFNGNNNARSAPISTPTSTPATNTFVPFSGKGIRLSSGSGSSLERTKRFAELEKTYKPSVLIAMATAARLRAGRWCGNRPRNDETGHRTYEPEVIDLCGEDDDSGGKRTGEVIVLSDDDADDDGDDDNFLLDNDTTWLEGVDWNEIDQLSSQSPVTFSAQPPSKKRKCLDVVILDEEDDQDDT